ncbi:MAG: B-4DMT family transporter [Mycobacterium sp.]|nr:B-4DMT family transporter [Mycobacterium sp.]
MSNWILRGLVFGAAMVVVRLFQGTLIQAMQTQAGIISIVLVSLFTIGVIIWGVIDGRADARANEDPDRRADLAMTWLLAGLLAGFIGGAVTWLISLFYKSLYVGGLINELTVFAAFTALVVFAFGIAGVAFGRWRIDRKGDYAAKSGDRDEDRADTDVFAAVRSDDGDNHRRGGEQEQSTSVATAEREEHHDPAYAEEAEETTKAHAPRGGEDPTEQFSTKGDPERTERIDSGAKRDEDER